MKVDDYLSRIGLNEVKENDLKMLSILQLNHLLHVPFENLDVIHNIPIALDVESYYQKVVTNNRGGFCYELNGLFHWLLKQLGYDCQLVAATVMRPDGTFAMERSHATQIVKLDQYYVVDVGFGDSAYKPLPLSGETREDVSGKYRVAKISSNIYELQIERDDQTWLTLQQIDLTPRQLIDFKEACHFNQTSPHSTFTQNEIVTIATQDGRYTLSKDELTITNHGVKEKHKIKSSEKQSVLRKYFSLQWNDI